MSTPRLLFFKQCITNPTFSVKLWTNPFHQIRRYISTNASKEIFNFVQKSPRESVVPLLEQYYTARSDDECYELQRIINKLRKDQKFKTALEVSEWISNKPYNDPYLNVPAMRLDLISKVHGIDAAERFFNELNDHSGKMYSALLSCYVQADISIKALPHFKKMKDMGFAKTHTYNVIMSLLQKSGRFDKIVQLLKEMLDNDVSPDLVTYRTCLKACASRSDFAGMEKILETMETRTPVSVDWFTYCIVANYFEKGGCSEKAIHYLQKAVKVCDNASCYNHLISMYAKRGDVTQVKSLLQQLQNTYKEINNSDYTVIISSLVKLDEFEEAEKLLKDWESSDNLYDIRVPEALLAGYSQKGLIEKAEKMLDGMISEGKAQAPTSWTIISEGHIKLQNMEKALQCMEKALQLSLQHEDWKPKRSIVSSILNWLGDNGDFEQVDKFLKLMSKVVPMNTHMYKTLLKTNVRHGHAIDDILQRMKDDDIYADEEIRSMIKSVV